MENIKLNKDQKIIIDKLMNYMINEFNNKIDEKDKIIEELNHKLELEKKYNNELENNVRTIKESNSKLFESKYEELINCFISKNNNSVKELIKYFIANDNSFENLSQDKKFELLFISYIYNMDNEIISKYYIFDINPIYKSYIELYELLKSDRNKIETKNLFDNCVGKFIYKNRKKLNIKNEIIDEIIRRNYKYVKTVEISQYIKRACDTHKIMLPNKKVFVDVIDNNNEEKVVAIYVRYCDECKKGFLAYNQWQKIKNKYKLKINN